MNDQSREVPQTIPTGYARRVVLSGAVAGALVPTLAACGAEPSPSAGSVASDPGAAGAAGAEGAAATPSPVVATDDVPVGSGVVVTDSRVVVTQPSSGEFRCFSAVCTHSGCLVSAVTTSILCTCHGSSFDIATGEVLGGPAPAPLPPVDFSIEKGEVVL